MDVHFPHVFQCLSSAAREWIPRFTFPPRWPFALSCDPQQQGEERHSRGVTGAGTPAPCRVWPWGERDVGSSGRGSSVRGPGCTHRGAAAVAPAAKPWGPARRHPGPAEQGKRQQGACWLVWCCPAASRSPEESKDGRGAAGCGRPHCRLIFHISLPVLSDVLGQVGRGSVYEWNTALRLSRRVSVHMYLHGCHLTLTNAWAAEAPCPRPLSAPPAQVQRSSWSRGGAAAPHSCTNSDTWGRQQRDEQEPSLPQVSERITRKAPRGVTARFWPVTNSWNSNLVIHLLPLDLAVAHCRVALACREEPWGHPAPLHTPNYENTQIPLLFWLAMQFVNCLLQVQDSFH